MDQKLPRPTVRVIWNQSLARIMQMHDEGYTLNDIHKALQSSAAARGLPFPTLATFKKYFCANKRQQVAKTLPQSVAATPKKDPVPDAVSISLPDDLSERLQDLAQRTGRSKAFYMVEAIRKHLDDLEDLYIAESRLIEIRRSQQDSQLRRRGAHP